jgi:hypothetical protein
MSYFSDRCNTPIDPATGRALSGEALEAALRDQNSPRCRAAVKKKARFCSTCGSPAPGGWRRCPNPACRKWVGNESAFCPHCRQALNPGDRFEVINGRWQRPAGELARRFETLNLLDDIKRTGLVIDAGTRALLLDGGKVRDVLEAGSHSLESLGHKINHWGNPPPRSVVLVDGSEHILPLECRNLKDARQQTVNMNLTLRWRLGQKERQLEAFFVEMLKGEDRLASFAVNEGLEEELSSILKVAVANLDAESLLRDPEGREKLHQELRERLEQSLETYGLELTRVTALEVTVPEIERLLEQEGAGVRARRSLDLEKEMLGRAAEAEAMRTRHKFDSREFQEQVSHEAKLRDLTREEEMRNVTHGTRMSKAEQEFEFRDRLRDHERENQKLGNQDRREDENLDKQHERENRKLDALSDDEIDRLTHQRDLDKNLSEHELNVRKTKDALELRKLKNAQTHEDKQKEMELLGMKAKILADLKPEVLLALEPDAEVRRDLQGFFEMRMKGEMSPEALLVLLAEKSPQAGQALFEKSGLDRQAWESLIQTQREDLRDTLDRQERLFNKAQETTAQAAKSGGGGTDVHIIK